MGETVAPVDERSALERFLDRGPRRRRWAAAWCVTAAAARETREETGYEVEVGRLVGVYSDPRRQVIEYPDGARVHSVNLCFLARPLSVGAPSTPEESLGVGFFPVRALPDPMVPIHGVRIRDALAGGEPAVR